MNDRYVKSTNSQCSQGVETYLSDAYVLRRDSQQPNFFIFGTDARTKRSIVEIHANGFDSHDADDDEDEENLVKNTVWLVDPTYEITASVFDENTKQTYMAVEHDQSAIIYKTSVRNTTGPMLRNLLIFVFSYSKIFANRIDWTNSWSSMRTMNCTRMLMLELNTWPWIGSPKTCTFFFETRSPCNSPSSWSTLEHTNDERLPRIS